MAKGVVRDGKALMVNRHGERVAVPLASLDQALEQGYQYEAPDAVRQYDLAQDARSLGGKVKTAGEALARGATVGLSDVALTTALGDDYRAAALARQQENPALSTAGEVAGAVAPILASGGTGLASRGVTALGAPARGVAALGRGGEALAAAALRRAGATGATALGRVGTKALTMAAGGAVEGAAYGVGKEISDAALGDTEITAEKILAGAEDGALFGGLGGGILGGAGAAVGEAGKKIVGAMTGGKSLAQAAKTFAEKRAVKAVTGNYKKAYDEITRFGKNPERIERLGRKLIDREINVDDLGEAIAGLGAATDDAAARMSTVAKELDAAGVKADARKLVERWDEQVKKLRDVDLDDYQKVAAELEKKIAPLRRRVEGAADKGVFNVTRDEAGKRVRTAATGQKEIGFSDFWKLRQQFDKTVKWNQKAQTVSADELREMRRIFDDTLTEAVDGADDGLRAAAAGGDDAARRALESGETLTGRWKVAKEDYHDFITLKDAADELAIAREKNRFVSPSDYGTGGLFGVGAMQALIASGGSALPSLLLSTAIGAGASVAHKFVRERGSAMIARAAERMAKVDGQLLRSARVIAGIEKAKRVVTPAVLGVDKLQERFDKLSSDVQTLTSQPPKLATRLAKMTGELDAEQPELGMAIRQRAVEDYHYLASEIPQPIGRASQTLTPQAIKYRYSPPDMKRWLAKAEALDKPMTVVRKLERGTIDREGLATLKARRPELFQDLRIRVASACAEREDELDPPTRVLLSLVFDITADPTMDPAAIRDMQASTVAPPNAEQRPGPPPRSFNPKLPEGYTLPYQKAMGS